MSIEYYEVDDIDRVVKIVKEVLERFKFIEMAVLFLEETLLEIST